MKFINIAIGIISLFATAKGSDLQKRAKTCDPISAVDITKTSNYQYGYNKYKINSGSVKTALSMVDGCSAKGLVNFGVNVNLIMDESPELFIPACNSHDACYICQRGKKNCDNRFKSHMIELCAKKWGTGTDSYDDCVKDAKLLYNTVHLDQIAYIKRAVQTKNYNNSDSCAFCGHSAVKDAYDNSYYLE